MFVRFEVLATKTASAPEQIGFTLETNLMEMLGSGSGISGGQVMVHAPQKYALRMVGAVIVTDRLV